MVAPAASWHMAPITPRSQSHSSRRGAVQMIDSEMIVGVGVLAVSIGGGVGLIAFTENAGKRDADNAQLCVECKGEKVLPCTLCKGSGVDPFASLVAGVKEMVDGDEGPKGNRILVDDWDEGQKEVEMYAEILGQYPVKATESVCMTCTGKGVVVCDNCARLPKRAPTRRPQCSRRVHFPAQARALASGAWAKN